MKVFICSIRTFRNGQECFLLCWWSCFCCNSLCLYIPGNTETVWGEEECNHALPHLCAYRTTVSNTFNQGFENVGYVQIELFM